ncbi:MAG: c-type cytochrome [Synechococcus sp.]
MLKLIDLVEKAEQIRFSHRLTETNCRHPGRWGPHHHRGIRLLQTVDLARTTRMARLHRLISSSVVVLLLGFVWVAGVQAAPEQTTAEGTAIFERHCVGCHINGGNIIRRGKTLQMAALERNGVASPEAIAAIARDGIGRMSGYGDVLQDGEDQQVAEWIWQQAQNAWIQG